MGGERGRIVGVGASLALLVALPLLITHVAGAARSQVTSAAAALLVVDADGATAMLPDGTARAAVPWLQPGDGDLAVSPSGRKLAFTRERSGNRELYVADLATGCSTVSRRSHDARTWSPPGRPTARSSRGCQSQVSRAVADGVEHELVAHRRGRLDGLKRSNELLRVRRKRHPPPVGRPRRLRAGARRETEGRAEVRGGLRGAPARRPPCRGGLVGGVHRSLPGVLPRTGSRPDRRSRRHLRPRPAREPRATTPRARLCEQRGVGARPGVLAVGSRATTASRRPPHLRGERTV